MPLTVLSLAWQWVSLPAMPPQKTVPLSRVLALLGRPHVRPAMVAVMLTFVGAAALLALASWNAAGVATRVQPAINPARGGSPT